METIITASISPARREGKIAQNRKENAFHYELALIDPRKDAGADDLVIHARALATLRIYSTQARAYACLWFQHGEGMSSGGGCAGGYEYPRASAAVQKAFEDAGVTLSEPIAGRGDSAINEAMVALGKALSADRLLLHKAHG